MRGNSNQQAIRCRAGRRVAIALAVMAAVLGFGSAGAQGATDHPTLVSVKSTVCTTCHEDLIKGHDVVHAVAEDDCTSCHEVVVGDEGTTVGLTEQEPALCLMCHDDLTSAFEGELAASHYPVTESCLTCHDPHATDLVGLTRSAVTELCSDCHDIGGLGASHGEQLTEATNCVVCHLPHGSQHEKMLAKGIKHAPFADGSCTGCHRAPFGTRIRLRSRGERLCEACHGSFAEHDTGALVVHAALEGVGGKAGCISCHDPHMGDQAALLIKSDPIICKDCHEEIVEAATASSGHPPAAEGCTNCHQPHVSEIPALLQMPPEELCSMCHDDTDEELQSSHLGADLAALDCMDCHDPHGTGHRALLARNLHAPMLDGCDTCHDGSHDSLISGGESPLCLNCHDDVGDSAQRAPVPHAALELARCADCHNPHASPLASLIKSPDGAICTECHTDQAAGEGEVAHGVIALIGCEACHEPHGGENSMLLRVEGDRLCLSCHDPRSVRLPRDSTEALIFDRFRISAADVRSMATLRLSEDGQQGHPIANHRVAGQPTPEELKKTETTFKDPMTCLTCHDPHKGRSREILRWDASSSMDACMHCHPK